MCFHTTILCVFECEKKRGLRFHIIRPDQFVIPALITFYHLMFQLCLYL